MKNSLKKMLSFILSAALAAAILSFSGSFYTASAFADPLEPAEAAGELVADQEMLGSAVEEYAEALESVAPVQSAGIVQSLMRFGNIAGSVASAVHAGVVFLQMIGVIQDPTAAELSKILDTVTNIEDQLYKIDSKLDNIAVQLYNLAAADEERDRQTRARDLLVKWQAFETSYVDPLENYVSEYPQYINRAINEWWNEETHEGVRALYTSLDGAIVPTYFPASYDAGFPETATNGEPVLLEYSIGLPSEYMPHTSSTEFDVNSYSATFCDLVTTHIITAANDKKLDASETFYTNWETLDDEGKTEKAGSYAMDLLNSLILRISKDAMTRNDAWVTQVKNAFNQYCKHIREKDSGLDALINVEYMTHGFEGETKDELTQIGESMIATCGYFGTFVQSIMEQDALQPAADLQAVQNTWADTILFLESKEEASLTGYDNFCYITHTIVDSDVLTIASTMTGTYKFAPTPTKMHTYKSFSSSEWTLTDSAGNAAENLPLVPNTSALVLYHTFQGQQTEGELFAAYLNRNGVNVGANFTGRFLTDYRGAEVFSLDDGVEMQADSAWSCNGQGVFSDGGHYQINKGNKKINNEYIILHDKVVGDYLDSKTGTLSTDQLLTARAAYFEGHGHWSNDQGWFFFSADHYNSRLDMDTDTSTVYMNTHYHALISASVTAESAAANSILPLLSANAILDGQNDEAASDTLISDDSPLLAFDRVSMLKVTKPQKEPDPYSAADWEQFYQENILLVSEDDENYREFLGKVIDHAADEYASQSRMPVLTQEEKAKLEKEIFLRDSDLCAELRANTSLDVLDVLGINQDEDKELALAKAVLPVSYLDRNGDPVITSENMDTCAFYETGVMLDIETVNKEVCALLKPAFYVQPELVIWDPVLEEFAIFRIPKDVIKELGLTMNVRLSAVSAQTNDAVVVEHYDNVIDMKLDKTSSEQIRGSGTDRFVTFTDSECSIFAFPGETTKVSVTVPKLTDISKAAVTGLSAKTYTGKALTPVPTVKMGTKKLVKGTDFTVSYKNNKNAGTATVTVKGKGNYTGTAKGTFKIIQAKNTFSKVTTSKNIKLSNLKKKNQTFTIAATVKEKAKKTFVLKSVPKKAKKYITVSKSGKVTVKKGLTKGTYKIKVAITAAKTKNYKKTTVTKTIKIVEK